MAISEKANRPGEPSNGIDKEVIVVTGSSGLIGKQIIERLANEFQVVGLDKKGNPYPLPTVENISLDITSKESIQVAMERIRHLYGNKIASVIHLAAYYDFSGEPSPLYEKVTVKGTQKLLAALQDFEVKQFIFSSTNLIYKPTEPGKKIDEDWPLAPAWDYPKSKVETEKVIRQNRGDIPAVLLRLAGLYDDEGHSIPISHQIQRIYEKSLTSHFFSGDLLHGNAFIHMEDLLSALEKTVAHRDSLPEEIAINISEPETYSYEELQNRIGQEVHGKEWDTYEIPGPIAKVGAWAQDLVSDSFIKPWMIDLAGDHYELDISRAKELIDWTPKHSLLQTIPTMVRDLKSDPKSWYKKNKLDLPSSLENEK